MPARYLSSLPPSTSADAIILLKVDEIREVVVTNAPTCPAGGYVGLANRPFMNALDAIDALVRLDNIIKGRVKVEFACRDDTRQNACGDDVSIRRKLSLLKPTGVRPRGRGAELAFMHGPILIHVWINPSDPEHVVVEHSMAPVP